MKSGMSDGNLPENGFVPITSKKSIFRMIIDDVTPINAVTIIDGESIGSHFFRISHFAANVLRLAL